MTGGHYREDSLMPAQAGEEASALNKASRAQKAGARDHFQSLEMLRGLTVSMFPGGPLQATGD